MLAVCTDVLTLVSHGNASMAANLLNDNIEIWILLWKDNIINETKLVRTLCCPVTQMWAHPWLDERSWHWCHPLIHNRADNDKPKPLTIMADSHHVCGWRRTSSSLSLTVWPVLSSIRNVTWKSQTTENAIRATWGCILICEDCLWQSPLSVVCVTD